MKVLGLTGGIGMGKSAADALLRERGIPVLDTDVVAREIVQPGQPALIEIRESFGPNILNTEGELRRGELAKLVFAESALRQKLENILHPRIRAVWQAQVAKWRTQDFPVGVVVIPLLFETNAEKDLDATVCIACSSATQIERLLPRKWPRQQLEQRIAAQFPIERKMERADFVVWTEGSIQVHAEQLDLILALHFS